MHGNLSSHAHLIDTADAYNAHTRLQYDVVCVDVDVILTRITAYTIATLPLINSAALGPGDYAWSGCFGLLRLTTHNWRGAAGRR